MALKRRDLNNPLNVEAITDRSRGQQPEVAPEAPIPGLRTRNPSEEGTTQTENPADPVAGNSSPTHSPSPPESSPRRTRSQKGKERRVDEPDLKELVKTLEADRIRNREQIDNLHASLAALTDLVTQTFRAPSDSILSGGN